MRPISLITAILAAGSVSSSSLTQRQNANSVEAIASFTPADDIAVLAAQALEDLNTYQSSGIASRSTTCSLKNVIIRKDWDHLDATARKSYINAVLCLQSRPSILDQTKYPGAKTRYDDFLAVHINQTLTIHGTGNFLAWHRYLTWTYEKALRDECGYDGYQPYWNWGTFALTPNKSAVFDGSDTSMSGNGAFLQHNGSVAGGGQIFLPSGEGGGCITSGPFKNYTVNLGPISPTQRGITKSNSTFAWNPRCLRRDISTYTSTHWLQTSSTRSLITTSPNILTFQNTLQGNFSGGFLGAHAGGHYTIGGDPGGDLYASPGDPVFFLHHAMVDRVWWVWQSLNLPSSLTAVAGTRTIFNTPPSPNTTVDDIQNLGPLGPEIRLGDLLSTTGGPFCYIYL